MPYTPKTWVNNETIDAGELNNLEQQYTQAMGDVAAAYVTQSSLTANHYTKTQSDARYLAIGAGTIGGTLTFTGPVVFSNTTSFTGASAFSGLVNFTNFVTFSKSIGLGLTPTVARYAYGLYLPRTTAGLSVLMGTYQDVLAYMEHEVPGSIVASSSQGSGVLSTLTRELDTATLREVVWFTGTPLPLTLTLTMPTSRMPLFFQRLRLALYRWYNISVGDPITGVKVELDIGGGDWVTLYNDTISWEMRHGNSETRVALLPEMDVSSIETVYKLRLTFTKGTDTTLASPFSLMRIVAYSDGAPWDLEHVSREPGDQFMYGLLQMRNGVGRQIEFDSTFGQMRGLGKDGAKELNVYIPSDGTFKVRQDVSNGTVMGRVVTTAGDVAKVATRSFRLQLWPNDAAKNTADVGDGDCVWLANAGGGPGAVKWKTTNGSSRSGHFVQATGIIPADYASGNLVVKARLRAVGSSTNIQNWTLYSQVGSDSEGNASWNWANGEAAASTAIGTSNWQTVTLKNAALPSNTGAGSHVSVNFGPIALSVVYGDVVLADVWCEYAASY